jgi:DMSO/TMAO reductase YedYZ molybdopterin-dependent catalytic subunit
MGFVSRGFRGRRREEGPAGRVPPGQYRVRDVPVLSAGPTPDLSLDEWAFAITGEIDEPRSWSWEELQALPSERVTVDIHCVTKWSKLDTEWEGVSLDVLLDGVETAAEHVLVHSYGGYTTNLPLEDFLSERALLADRHGGRPLAVEHGGPLRLVVPHLYAWKSCKWIRGLVFMDEDRPGYWERHGYHMRGDPFREERFG